MAFFLFTSYLHIDCIVGNPTLDRDTAAAAVEMHKRPNTCFMEAVALQVTVTTGGSWNRAGCG